VVRVQALTVVPGVAQSARLESVAYAVGDAEGVQLSTLSVGICGTDAEIIAGKYGWAPPGKGRLVLGHECVAQVHKGAQGYLQGEFVVPIVRRPDPLPCASCAVGEWDMCRNGGYTEHGIKLLDGFCAEQLTVNGNFLVRVPPEIGMLGVLVEPASVVAKAWEHIDRIGNRTHWEPRRVLITGAGPIGLLAALLGTQRNLEVCVFDRADTGAKPALTRQLGAEYFCNGLEKLLTREPPDIVIECTGADELVLDVMRFNAPGAVTCLLGVSAAGRSKAVDVGALNRTLVLENDVIFGSVNANRRHYDQAVAALGQADPEWLHKLITRRVSLGQWHAGFERQSDDIKVVIDVAS